MRAEDISCGSNTEQQDNKDVSMCIESSYRKSIRILAQSLQEPSYVSRILREQGLDFIINLLDFSLLEYDEYKAVLNCKDTNGDTLLHHAIKSGSNNLISKLLKHLKLVDLNARNNMGYTAIHNIACISQIKLRQDVIITLNRYSGFDLRIKNPATNFSILFMLLFEMEDFITANIVIRLDKKKAEQSIVNEIDHNTQTMLHIASYKGRSKIVKFLLGQPEVIVDKVDDAGYSALLYAIFYGKKDIFEYMLSDKRINFSILLGADCNIFHIMAHREEALPILGWIINSYCNSKSSCIGKRVVGIVDSLINNQNREGYTPLALATVKKNYGAMSEFMHCSAIDNYQIHPEGGMNVLHHVAIKNDKEALDIFQVNKDLVTHCIRDKDDYGNVPLDYAEKSVGSEENMIYI